jgi:hypothetical protein
VIFIRAGGFLGRKDLWNRQYIRRRVGDFDAFTQTRDDHYRRIIRLQRSGYHAEAFIVFFQTLLFLFIFSSMSYMDFIFSGAQQWKHFLKQQTEPEIFARKEEVFESEFIEAEGDLDQVKEQFPSFFTQEQQQEENVNNYFMSKVPARKFSKAFQDRHEAFQHKVYNDRPRMGSSVEVYYMHNLYDFNKQKMDMVNFLNYDVFLHNPSKHNVGDLAFIEILADRHLFAKGIMEKAELVVLSDYFLFYFYQFFDYVLIFKRKLKNTLVRYMI